MVLQEVHYNQHGLLLLQGQGIYRLGDKWCAAQTPKVVYMLQIEGRNGAPATEVVTPLANQMITV